MRGQPVDCSFWPMPPRQFVLGQELLKLTAAQLTVRNQDEQRVSFIVFCDPATRFADLGELLSRLHC